MTCRFRCAFNEPDQSAGVVQQSSVRSRVVLDMLDRHVGHDGHDGHVGHIGDCLLAHAGLVRHDGHRVCWLCLLDMLGMLDMMDRLDIDVLEIC